MSLTIGIPAYRDFDRAYEVARNLRTHGHSGPILVSVNDCDKIPDDRLEAACNAGIQMYAQEENLGLYGNFRWLANRCSTQQFMWLALDDEVPTAILNHQRLDQSSATLVFCAPVMVDPTGSSAPYAIPSPLRSEDVFNPHPSAIFGIWDAAWLVNNFPKRDFDWLDTYLLTRAVVRGRGVVQLPGFRVIGNAPKAPHRVNGKYHVPIGWILRSAALLLLSQSREFGEVKSFARGAKNRIFFSLIEWYRRNQR